MTRPLVLLLWLALLLPAHALAGEWAVGAGPQGIDRLAAQLPGAKTLVPGRSLLVRGARPQVRGAAYVVDLTAGDRRRVAFVNNEPDALQQWYLTQDLAWDHWISRPTLKPVRVAVVDSGIDYSHPDLLGQVVGGISYVGGSWRQDTCGHGTFVAGEIGANPFNGIGIAGVAFNAKLLIAKVVRSDCNVSTEAEIEGITWAVKHGAQVINLSIGGIRDPQDPELDTFSLPERDAVEYAYSKGVLVVAAAGNGTQAPRQPWKYADYPAALPHVLGVGAVRQSGAVPDYSNRDAQFVDIAAPGGPIFSTIPRNLIDGSVPSCAGVAYSNCGPSEFQSGIGTSFAAPQVSAAAALLLGVNPSLTPGQLEWLLERSATDANSSTGCSACPSGRDSLTGWGNLDIEAALVQASNGTSPPPADAYEPNDEAGNSAHPFGAPRTITATLDYWDDPIDVYSIKLTQGDQLFAHLSSAAAAPNSLALWSPGTSQIGAGGRGAAGFAAASHSVGGQQRLSYRVPATGVYYVEAKIDGRSRAVDVYDLSVAVNGPGA